MFFIVQGMLMIYFVSGREQIDSRTSTGIDGNKFLTSHETNFAFSGKCTFFILLTNCKVFLIAYIGLKLIYFGSNSLSFLPVSYTHLDVYKRQFYNK